MKARQVNFYLNNQDLERVEKYLIQKMGWQIIDARKPLEIQTLTTLRAQNDLPNVRYLVLPTQQKELEFNLTAEGNYQLNETACPVIEYILPHCTEKLMISGRFSYHTFLYVDRELKPQNETFLKKAQKFFRWFKFTFKSHEGEPFYHHHASEEICKMAEKMHFNPLKQWIEA